MRIDRQDLYALLRARNIPYEETAHPAGHIGLCVLMWASLVAHTATEPENADAFIGVDGVFDADAALRGCGAVFFIMVAVDIEHGTGRKGGQEGQILGL